MFLLMYRHYYKKVYQFLHDDKGTKGCQAGTPWLWSYGGQAEGEGAVTVGHAVGREGQTPAAPAVDTTDTRMVTVQAQTGIG